MIARVGSRRWIWQQTDEGFAKIVACSSDGFARRHGCTIRRRVRRLTVTDESSRAKLLALEIGRTGQVSSFVEKWWVLRNRCKKDGQSWR